ncbi:MAG: helix-hairpin-helix domain-containing protein [Candidatus Thorarchaeota archaeon]
MARKKKKETVQATLGDLEEPKKKPAKPKKKTASKKSPKKTGSRVKSKVAKKPSAPKTPEPQLRSLPGVGDKLTEKLAKAGYTSVDKISRARVKTLAKKVDGLSLSGAQKLVTAAKDSITKTTVAESPKTQRRSVAKPKKKVYKLKKEVPKPKKVEVDSRLRSLPGVGSKLAEKLAKAGYGSLDKISRARSKSLARRVDGLSLTGAKKLVSTAKETIEAPTRPEPVSEAADVQTETSTLVETTPLSQLSLTDLPGVGAKLAKELERSGYNTVARISRSRPSSVAKVVDGLSLKRATVLVDAAIELVRDVEIQTVAALAKPKPAPEEKPITKAEEPVTPEPEAEVEPEPLPEVVEEPPEEKPSKEPPKKAKKPKRKEVKPLEEAPPRRRPKRTKSGLPVPDSVKKLTKAMKKKWAEADARQAAIRAGELPDEEIAPLQETVEVVGLTSDETKSSLMEVAMEVLNEAMTTGRPAFEIPSRSGDNIVWDEIRDLLLLGMRTISRPYHSLASVVDATRTARVMEIIYELLKSNLHATKREVFYSDVNLFREQKRSDKIIEDVASMLHTTRDSVHVVASARGSAMGRVVIRDGGDTIDLTKMGTGGWAITPFLDQVEVLESDAEFIIMSEKDAAVMRLAEAKYWNRQPCIVLTGKGSGDIATRAFLRTLVKELEIPAFALVDSDPYGHYIYSVFLRGSKRLSYESPFIATPELKLLGVLSRDLDEYDIPKSVRIPMEPADIKRIKDMLKEPFVKANRDWVRDLQLMLKLKEKAEIQAFASHSFEYLTDDYLPRKLETGDWI